MTAEHDFQDWQRMLGVPDERVVTTMEEAMRLSGIGLGPLKAKRLRVVRNLELPEAQHQEESSE